MAKGKRQSGARKRLRAFLEKNVGRVVTTEELRGIAGIGDYGRRIREVRSKDGLQLLSHNDRESLKPNEYLLETLELRPVVASGISGKLRRSILERNGFTCHVCGAEAGEESGCEPGKKCRLQIDHILPIGQGGTDEEHNLRAVCVYYNKDKANIIKPASGQAVSALAVIRKLPRDIQLEVYRFLAKKFDKT
jgi:hypothetical protein